MNDTFNQMDAQLISVFGQDVYVNEEEKPRKGVFDVSYVEHVQMDSAMRTLTIERDDSIVVDDTVTLVGGRTFSVMSNQPDNGITVLYLK